MKKLTATLVIAAAMMTACNTNAKVHLKNDKDKQSYALGFSAGSSLLGYKGDLNWDVLVKGVKDANAGKQALTNEELSQFLNQFQTQQAKKQQQRALAISQKNKAEGDKFLAQNKAQKGVITLPSGLQYKVIKKGSGKKKPKSTDQVTVHYKGTLLDGTEFDSSFRRNQPATFPVNGVIKGWTEALQKMKKGDKWKVFIDPMMAYGEEGRPGIPSNSILIFEIELLSIE